jgi:hypothetical protein
VSRSAEVNLLRGLGGFGGLSVDGGVGGSRLYAVLPSGELPINQCINKSSE